MVSRFYTAANHALRQLPDPARTVVEGVARRVNRSVPGRRVRWGNIARRAPFSGYYGWDRGLPVDRYYIERFLDRHRHRIRGSVLEVRSAMYASQFGHAQQVTVLDIDPANPLADLVADLNHPGSVPTAAFDCVILTQVLQYTDPVVALRNVGQSLRPGGCALVTVPSLSPIDPAAQHTDRWRWTSRGLEDAIRSAGLRATVEGHGNALSAVAFMLGLAFQEIPARRLGDPDSRFPIVACAVVEPEPPGPDTAANGR